MILVVASDFAKWEKVTPGNFISMNVWERQHIEEWVRTTPEVLGEELLIVSIEFDRFVGSADRLDVLAVDRRGNLVVIELKRDTSAGYADLQAIRYAAMISAMTLENLVPYYVAYRKKFDDKELQSDDARAEIVEFVQQDDFEELSNRPRIILCSEDFSLEVTTSVLWLRQFDVDISCVRITPYKVGDQIVVVPNRIIPLQEAKQYLSDIQKKDSPQPQQNSRRRGRTMKILIESGLVREGQRIFLKNDLPSHLQYDADDARFHATITGKLGQSNSVLWEEDGQEYSISNLVWKFFRDTHPDNKNPGGINGNWHFMTEDGKTLWALSFNAPGNTDEFD